MSEETQGNLPEKFKQDLLKADPEFFEALQPKQRDALVQVVSRFSYVEQTLHSGPLPHPEILAEYSKLIPDGAERIMKMAEKQQAHRMFLESTVIPAQVQESSRGQLFAFIIGILAVLCSTICIVTGHEISGTIFGVGGITGLVSAFIIGRSQQRKSLDKKDPGN